MDPRSLQKLANRIAGKELAGRSTDPRFYGSLTVLPNPDVMLRQMGRADEVYDSIISDAHVIGELRTMKATLQNFHYRLSVGDEKTATPQEKKAREICQAFLKRAPAPDMTWRDVFWNMGTSVLRGFRVHELEWRYDSGLLLPVKTLDRPNRRFVFDTDNKLKLLTRLHPVEGEPCEPYLFVLSRHMPSHENPYGVALLSSCFWPYTFKHGGWKFFYQFCERFGLPWPIGKYPQGTTPEGQNELLDALLEMLASGVAVIPEGDSVELMEARTSGELAQEALIRLCNREMSKALTSQTLATETDANGARAAAQVHADRQDAVGESDRSIIETTMSQIFAYITAVNVGPDVPPPTFEFYSDSKGTKERAEVYKIAAELSPRVSLQGFHDEMGIPMAADDEETLKSSATGATPVPQIPPNNAAAFSAPSPCRDCGQIHSFAAADPRVDEAQAVIDSAIARDWIEPVAEMLQQYQADGKTLQQFLQDLPSVVPKMKDGEVNSLFAQAFQLAFADGMSEAI